MKFNAGLLNFLAVSEVPSDKRSYLFKRGAFLNTGTLFAKRTLFVQPPHVNGSLPLAPAWPHLAPCQWHLPAMPRRPAGATQVFQHMC